MNCSCDEGDLKAGFFYDIKFVVGLLFIVFAAFSFLLGGLSAFSDFGVIVIVFLSLMAYLDLQETIEVQVPRHGWVCSKRDFKLASAFLLVSLLLTPIGYYLLSSEIAAKHPLTFLFSLALLLVPTLLGIAFALNCYLAMGRPLGYWKKDEEIAKALLKHSFFYPKTYGRKATQKIKQTTKQNPDSKQNQN